MIGFTGHFGTEREHKQTRLQGCAACAAAQGAERVGAIYHF
jgi:hypothetical protein